jgi:purine nucleoside phosphorylase
MTWNEYSALLNNAASFLKSRISVRPDIGLILGRNLDFYSAELLNPVTIKCTDFPGISPPSPPSHSSNFIFGKIGSRTVLAFLGPPHFWPFPRSVNFQFPGRLLGLVGCRLVIITEASGGSSADYHLGDCVPISDHANLTQRSYSLKHLSQFSMYVPIPTSLRPGMFAHLPGPIQETPAEALGLNGLGVTLFGTSIVGEAIALKELGVPTIGFVLITHLAPVVMIASKRTHTNAVDHKIKFINALNSIINEVSLSDFPIPEFRGNNLNIVSSGIAYTDKEMIESSIDALLPGQRVNQLIVLAAGHKLPEFVVEVSILLSELQKFPLEVHENLMLSIGSFASRRVAIISGIENLCGLSLSALYFLIIGMKHLGATSFVQTFHSISLREDGKGPSLVKNVMTLFEGSDEVSFAEPTFQKPLNDGEVVLGACRGSELPTQLEISLLKQLGVTEVTFGTTRGLLLARALELRDYGIADGALRLTDDVLKLTDSDSFNLIVQKCALLSSDIARQIVNLRDLQDFVRQPLFYSFQSQPENIDIDQIFKQHTESFEMILLCNSINDPIFTEFATGQPLDIPGQIIHKTQIKNHKTQGKNPKFLIAIRNVQLVAAATKCRMGIIFLLDQEEDAICVTDHLNICGSSLLNNSPSFSPNPRGLYWQASRLITVTALLANDAIPANCAAARVLGASTLAPPSLGKDVLNIVVGHGSRPTAICGKILSHKEEILDYLVSRQMPFRSVEMIGEGSRKSIVEKSREVGTIAFFALKKLVNSEVMTDRDVKNYKKIAREVAHPNIAQLFDNYDTKAHTYLVMELCAGGDFASILANDGPLPIEVIRNFAGDIASGLNYLHRHDIICRELGPWNVLMNECGVLKLGDLSHAILQKSEPRHMLDLHTLQRMRPYSAPERQYSIASDIWTLGCIMYEMATGRTPFGATSDDKMKELIGRGEFEDPPNGDPDFINLLRRMLVVDPGNRIGWTEIIDHQFWGNTLVSRAEDGPYPLSTT